MRKNGWIFYLITLLSIITFSIYSIGFLNFLKYFLIGILFIKGFSYVLNRRRNRLANKELEEIELREREHKERVLAAFKR